MTGGVLRLLYCSAALLLLSSSGGSAVLHAAEPVAASRQATSDRHAEHQAARAIPWARLPAEYRRDVHSVVRNATIYRRLPTRTIHCDPELLTFLLRHPEVVVDVWHVLGISRVALERTAADRWRGTDNAGTTGQVQYVMTEWGPEGRNLAVAYAEGAYDGPPFVAPLRASSVLLLRTHAAGDHQTTRRVTIEIDAFIHVEQVAVDLVARTVQPWIHSMADRNFVDTARFVSTFSRTAERNPQGIQRLAARLTNIDEPTRRELVRLCFRAAERHAQHSPATGPPRLMLAQRTGEE